MSYILEVYYHSLKTGHWERSLVKEFNTEAEAHSYGFDMVYGSDDYYEVHHS